MRSALDVDPTELANALDRAAKFAQGYACRSNNGPVVVPPLDTRALGLTDRLPEHGIGLEAVMVRIIDDYTPHASALSDPGFMGLITTGGNPYSLAADGIATALNQHVARGGISALAAAMEDQVLRWIGAFIGFPVGSGILTSGGSLANLTALGAARAQRFGQRDHPPGLVVYASDQSHFSVQRACDTLGLGRNGLRQIPSNAQFQIDLAALRVQIAADRASGLIPLAVVANAGTVFTGAVDPLDDLATLCEAEGLWLHVDGAYGAPAAGTTLAGPLFRGIGRADSVAVDAHKWFFVPYEAGCVLVRDRSALRNAYSYAASYTAASADATVDFMDLGLQMSRDFKALKIWALFAGAGAIAIRRAIESNIRLMRDFAEELRGDERFELLAPCPLSIVCFRPAELADPARDCRAIEAAIRDDGRAFITTVQIGGQVGLRACSVNHRATTRQTRFLKDQVLAIAARLRSRNAIAD